MTGAALNRPLLVALAGFKLALHLLLAGRYGYFRDEMYFLDCGRHLSFGYVDHAPLIALVARAALALGGSLYALRVFPAVAGAVLVALAMLIAWRLGGGRFAQAVAGVAVLAAPVYLAGHGLMTMNTFEQVFWTAAVYVLVRIIQTGDGRRWILFGLILGLDQVEAAELFLGFGEGPVGQQWPAVAKTHRRRPVGQRQSAATAKLAGGAQLVFQRLVRLQGREQLFRFLRGPIRFPAVDHQDVDHDAPLSLLVERAAEESTLCPARRREC